MENPVGLRISIPDETQKTREKELENRSQTLERQLNRLSDHISDEGSSPAVVTPRSA